MELQDKYSNLKDSIKKMGTLAVAFSGGVDSTFLLKVAHDCLGDGCIAVTAKSSTFPEREYNAAVKFCKEIGVRHIVIESEELDIEGFAENPVNRCYFCKHELFSKIQQVALDNKVAYVADGSNVDDLGDYRPGLKAVEELKVVSPLREAKMVKDDIRALSKDLLLDTWNKQAFACLSSRFPYGQKITKEKLEMIDKTEQYLLDCGFREVRVRHHGDIARIEVGSNERSKFFDEKFMDETYKKFKEVGFKYVSLDLKGYRTGSMNEVLSI